MSIHILKWTIPLSMSNNNRDACLDWSSWFLHQYFCLMEDDVFESQESLSGVCHWTHEYFISLLYLNSDESFSGVPLAAGWISMTETPCGTTLNDRMGGAWIKVGNPQRWRGTLVFTSPDLRVKLVIYLFIFFRPEK